MAIQFQHDYQLLELDAASDWHTANKNYRRLVHAWHPDRYTDRPREREHAQKQFIELTKAFNNLRTFYRTNHRLPFEKMQQAVADSPEPPEHQQIKPAARDVHDSSMLTKRAPSKESFQPSALKPLLWIIPSAAVIGMGLAVFIVIDNMAKQKTIEEAKRVLRNAEPSEYMADDDEATQARNRENILRGASGEGKMGDKLLKDIFK